jgi:hypothetical protein
MSVTAGVGVAASLLAAGLLWMVMTRPLALAEMIARIR